jgi:hypothetical protein
MIQPVKTEKKQATRFKPGKSGNPNGRPQGSRNKTTLAMQELFDGEAEAITRVCIDKAKQGDGPALRLCMERLCPPRKDGTISFEVPPMDSAGDAINVMSAVLTALGLGNITPSEAQSVAGIVETFRRTLETCQLEARMTAALAKLC